MKPAHLACEFNACTQQNSKQTLHVTSHIQRFLGSSRYGSFCLVKAVHAVCSIIWNTFIKMFTSYISLRNSAKSHKSDELVYVHDRCQRQGTDNRSDYLDPWDLHNYTKFGDFIKTYSAKKHKHTEWDTNKQGQHCPCLLVSQYACFIPFVL